MMPFTSQPHQLHQNTQLIHNTQMCITFFHLRTQPNHSGLKFIIAFNRDENSGRETSPFGQFEDDKHVYAGRDMVSGGSWLGINVKTGIMVILTNYKKIKMRVAKSRGLLVKYFLSSKYLENFEKFTPKEVSNKIYNDMVTILQDRQQYSPHNISVYNIRDDKVFYMCSEIAMKEPIMLENNLTHGYSNTDINTNWQKVQRGKDMFQTEVTDILEHKDVKNEEIFEKLQRVMKDQSGTSWFWKYFETSIFISPYYNWYWRSERKTKSTFYAIFTQKEGAIEAQIREVTYNGDHEEKVQLKLTI